MSVFVESALGAAGPLAHAVGPSFEARPEQIEMARAVASAMASGGHLLAEAGTGVGKSFAYLVPAIERCLEHGETVVVATNTIALQEQLVRKDIPTLLRALGLPAVDAELPDGPPDAPIRPALVKGRGNYVSLRRLELASARQDKLFADPAMRRTLHQIEGWARITRDGSVSSLPQLERPGIWDRVQSDSANCMGRKCPNYDICFYQRSRRTMERANLIICNHAVFFSDLALRARGFGFLPPYQRVVLDEAHMAEDVASEHFGVSLPEGRVNHLLSALFVERGAKGFLANLATGTSDTGPVERAIGLVREAREAAGAFFESLALWRRQRADSAGRAREPGIVDNILTPAFRELAVCLRRLREDALAEADRFELNAYAERASEIADAAEVLIEHTLAGCAYWVDVAGEEPGSRGTRVTIACSPVEVAPLLREHLFGNAAGGHSADENDGDRVPGPRSVIMTSATLTTRHSTSDEPAERREAAFLHTIERLGCDGARTFQVGSSFDYARQVRLFVDPSMPTPGSGRDAAERYHRALAQRVLRQIEATDGGAFVLFTSFAALNDVADHLAPELREIGMPMLVQGRDGPRSLLLERFRDNPRSVLFGAASFWQGIDVRGDGLRNVIITRLPFDPPDRPLTEARLERIRERGGDPFREESLPRAILRFKQGFGRLIRGRDDRGRVSVLDPRIVTSGYGRLFLSALPEGIEIERLASPGEIDEQ